MPETDKIKVYYLASGHIGIPLLRALLSSEKLELVGVASQLKTSKSTGPVRTSKSPLVQYCEKNGLEISRFTSVNTDEFYDSFTKSGARILIVASFGQLLKKTILELPEFGCLNIHASLLPKYRGASPIVAALLDGEKKTGVSFMQMEAGLDTGPVYRTVEMEISPDDNADTLEERLGVLAGENVESVVVDIVQNGLRPVPQPAECSTYAKKISKEDGHVNWEKSACDIANMVRAYTPWPSVRTQLPTRNDTSKTVKIVQAEAVEWSEESTPGQIVKSGREGITIACGQGALLIKRLVPEGKKEMAAGDYLLGYPIPKEHPYVYDLQ